MKLEISSTRASLCTQQTTHQFYLQFDYGKRFFFSRIFTFDLKGGITTWRSYKRPELRLYESIGFYIDVTVLNIRLGIYIHPIVYRKQK